MCRKVFQVYFLENFYKYILYKAMSNEQVFEVIKAPTIKNIIEGRKNVLVTKIGEIITDNKEIKQKVDKDNVNQHGIKYDNYLYVFPINEEIDTGVILQHYNENMDKNEQYEQKKKEEAEQKEKEKKEQAEAEAERELIHKEEEEEKKVHDINVKSKIFIINKISNYLTNNKNIHEGFVVGGYLRLSINSTSQTIIYLTEDEIINDKNLANLKMHSGGYFKRLGNNKVYINLKVSEKGNDDGIDNEYFLDKQELFSIRPIIEGKIRPVSEDNMMKRILSNLSFFKKKGGINNRKTKKQKQSGKRQTISKIHRKKQHKKTYKKLKNRRRNRRRSRR